MARGCIRRKKRKDGIHYEAVVDIGPDPITGRRRQRTWMYRTKREAEAALAKRIAEVDGGTVVEKSTATLREMLHYWLENEARPNVRPVTYAGYEQTIQVHIIPVLGAVRLQKLTAKALMDFYSSVLRAAAERGRDGRRTAQLCHLRIRQALDLATRLGVVPRNVADSVSAPRPVPKEVETWTPEECSRFWAHAQGSCYGPIWLVALLTGMRRAELLGLRWRDIDWGACTISVRQGAVPVRGVMTISRPKTPSSRRTVVVSDRVIEALRFHRVAQNERRRRLGAVWKENDLVFASDVGTPIGAGNLRRDYRKWCERAGVRMLNIHAVRHTYASVALAAGENPKAIAENLGHDPAVLLKIYSHVHATHRQKLARSVDTAMFEDVTNGHAEGEAQESS